MSNWKNIYGLRRYQQRRGWRYQCEVSHSDIFIQNVLSNRIWIDRRMISPHNRLPLTHSQRSLVYWVLEMLQCLRKYSCALQMHLVGELRTNGSPAPLRVCGYVFLRCYAHLISCKLWKDTNFEGQILGTRATLWTTSVNSDHVENGWRLIPQLRPDYAYSC